MRIKEFAAFTGVSVRTLHYYDEIGLLVPACVDRSTGYRYYDGNSLLRMQEILFYRELDFSLKSIGEILSSPDYDRKKALKEQKHLLMLKKERLEGLISAIDGAMKGENVMSAFDNSKFESYKEEAKAKWGKTEAYREYEQRGSRDTGDGLMAVFAELGKVRQLDPAASEVQELVKNLQDFITANYYTCTKQILQGLGQMYAADPRFKENIDRAGGAGTADFAARAIEIYCR
ncbi:MAG: MerR family transcriptional regulator [Oscillospiraceae bacterium]|nr:MerR family transcriptional regulator [Oscillospiraceae bacterium]